MVENYWEKIYQGRPEYYSLPDEPSYAEIVKHIGENDSVLDLGCGQGALFKLLQARDTVKYTGIDYSAKAISLARAYEPLANFRQMDSRDLSSFRDNEYDVVVMRHFLENQEDWRKVTQEAFRIANKKVIVSMRKPFTDEPSRLLESPDDTFAWEINYGEFNMLCRQMSVNVSFGKVSDEEFVIIGKHLDEAVFELDDFHDTNHNLPILLNLKERFPGLKVTLFCIPSKCSVQFISELKRKYDWMDFCIHGWFHDTRGLTAQECNFWTVNEANTFLDLAEAMGVFSKVFRAPGWNTNIELYQVLSKRGYIIADHRGHDRWEKEIPMKRYTTGHLWEVHGHVQNVCMNGLEELATSKCNFGQNTRFHFITDPEVWDEKNYLPNAYQ